MTGEPTNAAGSPATEREVVVYDRKASRLQWMLLGCPLIGIGLSPQAELGLVASVFLVLSGAALAVTGIMQPRETVLADTSTRELIVRSSSLLFRQERRISSAEISEILVSPCGHSGIDAAAVGFKTIVRLVDGERIEIVGCTQSKSAAGGAFSGTAHETAASLSQRLGLPWREVTEPA